MGPIEKTGRCLRLRNSKRAGTRGFEPISATGRPSTTYFIRCLHSLLNALVQIANII
jgi:hypothetical protein